MAKLFLTLGSLNMALAVGLGAFGAHGLKNRLTPDLLDIYTTGVEYHFYHALGLLLVGLVGLYGSELLSTTATLKWSGWMMQLGILVFSGSLYVLSISGIRWLGAITPIGGLAFIAGWLLLAYTIWQYQ
ncbi:MAG: DUF423 domain-containing protein [Bacteroidota bacterium]